MSRERLKNLPRLVLMIYKKPISAPLWVHVLIWSLFLIAISAPLWVHVLIWSLFFIVGELKHGLLG